MMGLVRAVAAAGCYVGREPPVESVGAGGSGPWSREGWFGFKHCGFLKDDGGYARILYSCYAVDEAN
jgi:hypothetical protein